MFFKNWDNLLVLKIIQISDDNCNYVIVIIFCFNVKSTYIAPGIRQRVKDIPLYERIDVEMFCEENNFFLNKSKKLLRGLNYCFCEEHQFLVFNLN